jgi:hypothetical protein
MILKIRVKKNCPRTYMEKITKDRFIVYLSRDVVETAVDEAIIKLVSREFVTPPHKIRLETVDPVNKTIEIL